VSEDETLPRGQPTELPILLDVEREEEPAHARPAPTPLAAQQFPDCHRLDLGRTLLDDLRRVDGAGCDRAL
jgi:hypothetical protein